MKEESKDIIAISTFCTIGVVGICVGFQTTNPFQVFAGAFLVWCGAALSILAMVVGYTGKQEVTI